MSTSTLHPAAAAYLADVRREGRDLSGDRLAELLVDLEEHLSSAIPADASADAARELLRRFGDPREIVAAERPEANIAARRRGTQEWAAVFLLLFGFVAAGIGWIVGVVLLWRSRAWTLRDKLIGSLVLPGGLLLTVVLFLLALGAPHKVICTRYGTGLAQCSHGAAGGPAALASTALVLLALTPIATAVYLARRAR